METNSLNGEVIFLDKIKGFGFLRSANLPNIFFPIGDPDMRSLPRKTKKAYRESNPTTGYSLSIGDLVHFKIRNSVTKPGHFEAFEVTFISNPHKDKFMQSVQD